MRHITKEQRYTISQMLAQGFSQKEIAETIGKDKSVVSREISRNKDGRSGIYRYELAERKCRKRHKEKRKREDFSPSLQAVVEKFIEEDYSPEQITGYCKQNGMKCVSPERIYQHIWADKKRGGNLYSHLRRKGRKYMKRANMNGQRGTISNRVSIDQRPAIVDKRNRFGDLEVDLIIGKNHKKAIVTINDRASGVLKMKKVKSKEAEVVSQAIIELLGDWTAYIKTITSDNGKAFSLHELVSEQLGIDYFFAHPYHSWERGSNENLNGLIRQYIPKKADFDDFSDEQIIPK